MKVNIFVKNSVKFNILLTIGLTETGSSVSEQNAISWHCFTFSKEPIRAALNTAPYADMIAHLATPSVISHMMPASFDGQVS